MNERSERATQDQGGGRPRERGGGSRSAAPAEPAADWYVADTYANDPYAAEAFGSADPYGAIDLPGAGPDETDTPEGSAAVPGGPGRPTDPALRLTAPAPRWASIAAEVAAGAATVPEATAEVPAEAAPEASAAAPAEEDAGSGKPGGQPRWQVPSEPEPVEDYVGVDALLSATGSGSGSGDSTESTDPADGPADDEERPAPGPHPYV